jgi:hypothetical protein
MLLKNRLSLCCPFVFSFTITFFAKEEPNCTIIPQFPEVYSPTRFHFQKGPGQKFLQPSGTGTDLSFFVLDDLSKPLEEDVYPLVISAETIISPNSISEQSSVHKQVTQAVLEKDNDGSFKVKVVKQILWIEGVRYELRELYGSTTQGAASGLDESGSGTECVICMTEAKDTAVLPCRHLVTLSQSFACGFTIIISFSKPYRDLCLIADNTNMNCHINFQSYAFSLIDSCCFRSDPTIKVYRSL